MILDPPSGYCIVLKNGLNIVFKEGYTDTFRDFVIPDSAADPDSRRFLQGRGPLVRLPVHENSEEHVVVRKYFRGGVLGRFLRDKYLNLGTPRPLKELAVSEFAHAHDIPTPDILAAAVEKVGPFFYKGALAMREIQPGRDLQTELLDSGHSPGREALEKKRQAISLLGSLVAKMHAAGIYHADLHLKNILISDGHARPTLYVLDLDAARILRPFSDFRRCLNLMRLYRSARKVNARNRVISRTDYFRFLRAYAGESSRTVRELVEQLERMLPWWRLKWKFSDMLGV
jgi:tRNA A-37 threonylcarbamoyl transferase component Bud32